MKRMLYICMCTNKKIYSFYLLSLQHLVEANHGNWKISWPSITDWEYEQKRYNISSRSRPWRLKHMEELSPNDAAELVKRLSADQPAPQHEAFFVCPKSLGRNARATQECQECTSAAKHCFLDFCNTYLQYSSSSRSNANEDHGA